MPVANPANIEPLIDLAVMLKTEAHTPIYPLAVVADDRAAKDNVVLNQHRSTPSAG